MKKLIPSLLAGIMDGTIGSDFVKILDDNKDGSVSIKEAFKNFHKLKELSVGQWIKILISTGITVFAVVK